MMAMSPGDEERQTVMGRAARRHGGIHGQTMDLDTQEGVGLHSSHIDAMMRGEFRAGRGRGSAEGFNEAAEEWPKAWESGWQQGASDGEEFVLNSVAPQLDALIADVAAAIDGFKKMTDKKVTKAMLHEELSIIATRLNVLHEQHVELLENITGG